MAGGRSAAAAVTLCGRHDERALVDGLLEGARAGQSGALVLRGAAGIGKTALLEYAVESASDLTVLRAVGRAGARAGVRGAASGGARPSSSGSTGFPPHSVTRSGSPLG